MVLLLVIANIFLIIPFMVSKYTEIPVDFLNITVGLLKVQDQYNPNEVEECGILLFFIIKVILQFDFLKSL